MYQEILNHFPNSSMNNSRQIVRGLMDRMIKKPSYGVEKRLEKLGVGIDHTTEGVPESFYWIEWVEVGGDPNEPF